MELTSQANQKIKAWQKLQQKKYRDLAQEFLVEGEHLLAAARAAQIVKTVITTAEFKELYQADVVVSPTILKKLSATISGSPVVAVCRYFTVKPNNLNKVIILDEVQDPGNVGTIIRSALAFGFDEVFLAGGSDQYNPKLIRATQGAIFGISVKSGAVLPYLASLQAVNIPLYIATAEAKLALEQVPNQDKLGLIFGNEGQGVSELIRKNISNQIKIPQATVESLNVAIAASIMLYHFRRQEGSL